MTRLHIRICKQKLTELTPNIFLRCDLILFDLVSLPQPRGDLSVLIDIGARTAEWSARRDWQVSRVPRVRVSLKPPDGFVSWSSTV